MLRRFGFSFSWKRALGISGAKSRLSDRSGIPLTRSGLDRKIGRSMTTGCGVWVMLWLVATRAAVVRLVGG
jgi:hypothetical protein